MIELVVVWVLWGSFIEGDQVQTNALDKFQSEAECKQMLPVVEKEMKEAYPKNPGYFECVRHRVPKVQEKK